jgi:hypothetical protein
MSNNFDRLTNLRCNLADIAKYYMETELRLTPDSDSLKKIKENPNINIVEFAHTPHFGHLGFLHMLIRATSLVNKSNDKVLLFVSNNHVRADALPTIRYIPMMRGGEWLNKPPQLGISKPERRKPLCYTKIPNKISLNKACEVVTSILLFERSRSLKPISKGETIERVRWLFDFLIGNSLSTNNYAAWCLRSLYLLLCQIFGSSIPVLIIPSYALIEIMPNYFEHALKKISLIIQLQNRVNLSQKPNWPEWSRPKLAKNDYFPGWIHIDQHQDVTDKVSKVDGLFKIKNGNDKINFAPENNIKISPKVVLRQPLANLLNLEYRVCGNRLGYWEVADELSEILFDTKPPERFSITSNVKYNGISGLEKGPTSMLRVLSELPITEIATQMLATEPNKDIIIYNKN